MTILYSGDNAHSSYIHEVGWALQGAVSTMNTTGEVFTI